MLEVINLSNKELEKIKKNKLGDGSESDTYIYEVNGEKKVIKIFKNSSCTENKIKKIKLMNDRLRKCDFVVTADYIIKNEGNIIGYCMKKIDGTDFEFLNYKMRDIIETLKDLSNKIKQLHKLNIICADFHRNFIIDKNNKIFLIDYDNFSIDNFPVDIKNFYLHTYLKSINRLDKNFDTYLMNLFTLTTITRIQTLYLYHQYNTTPREFNFRDKEINDIIYNTFNLGKRYDEDLIINKINTKKDLKKIKRKIF